MQQAHRRSRRFRGLLYVSCLCLFSTLSLAPAAAAAPERQPAEPVARFYLFYSETCPHCQEIMEEYLPTVSSRYGEQVEVRTFNIHEDNENYVLLLGLGLKLEVPEGLRGFIPAIFIGDDYLIGEVAIVDGLETAIDEALAAGGVDYPSLDDLPEVVLPTPVPVVQVLVFLDPAAEYAGRLEALLASLRAGFPAGFQDYTVDVTKGDNQARLETLHLTFGLDGPPASTPEVLVDRRFLIGLDEIEAELPGLVDDLLAQGGSMMPAYEELVGEAAQPEPIYVAYFEQAGCQECARTTYDLQVVQEQVPQLVVERFAIEEAENKALSEWLGERYGVPEARRLTTPMLFVGSDVLIGDDARLENLLPVVATYADGGAGRTWDGFDQEQAEQSLVERFQSLGVLAVLGAGLIDGLNPCAFATLVFFVSYAAFSGRRGREILLVGLAFTLGVLVTYLLVGLGMLRAVQSLGVYTSLGRWVYLLTALLCMVLAALTLRDALTARQGRASEMTLKLPRFLRRRINRIIRESARVRAFAAVALATGFVVSLVELACTGQVYLPTIIFVMSVPDLAARATFYLVLYCLMFVLPLAVVFVLSYLGTTSAQLARFLGRHTPVVKLATGLLFGALALWMAWTLAPLFGLAGPWPWLLLGVVLVLTAGSAALLHVVGRSGPAGRPSVPGSRGRPAG